MKCDDVQAKLIDLLYGELGDRETASLHAHLDACATCRRDFDALAETRGALALVPGSNVRVDVNRIHADVAARAVRSRRRWRWTALAAAALAGVVTAVGLAGVQIELRADHVVVSWGESPPVEDEDLVSAESPEDIEASDKLDEHEARLAHLDELMRLVITELDNSEQRQQAWLTEVARQVSELQTLSNVRWDATEQGVTTLYQWAQYTASNPSEGGER